MCLICCHSKVSLMLRRPQKTKNTHKKNNCIQVLSAEKGSHVSLPNPQSIDPPTHTWQANRLLQTYQENLTPNSTFIPTAQNGKNLDLHPPTENFNPTDGSQMLIRPCRQWYHTVAWNRLLSILMESRSQSCLSRLSYTLQMCSDERASVCPPCTCP